MATLILRPFIKHLDEGYTANTGDEIAAADPGDDLSHDDDVSYMGIGSGSNTKAFGYRPDPAFRAIMAAVTGFTVKARVRRIGSATNNYKLQVTLNGVETESGNIAFGTSYAVGSWDAFNDRPNGGIYGEGDFRHNSFGFQLQGSAAFPETRITSLWGEVIYVASGAQIEAARGVGSRSLRMRRKAMNFIDLGAVERKFLRREIGNIIGVSHFAVPHESRTGTVTPVKKWERKPHIITQIEYNQLSQITKISLWDGREFWLNLWDVAKSELSATSQRDGVPSLDGGANRTFLRDSSAWVEDPGDGRIVQVASQTEKNTTNGHLLEKSATNYLLGSNFSEGYATRWTAQGVAGGATVVDDTSDLLWDSGETLYSCKITAADPLGGTPIGFHQTTASLDADLVITVAVSHKDDSGVVLSVLIQRGIDSWYWNDATPGWQAGSVTNDLTVRSSKDRDQINNIDVGGGATTIKVLITAETTAGQINHVYDAQIENTEYATSRIMTVGTTVTRADDEFYYSNTVSARTFSPVLGTAFTRIIPLWSTADLPTNAKKTLFYCEYDVNHKEHIYYDQATSAWVFVRTVNGTEYIATKAATITKGVAYDIGLRWGSEENEFDLIPAGWQGTGFDGSNDRFYRGSDIEGILDGKQGNANFWFYLNGGDGDQQIVIANNTTRFFIQRNVDNNLYILGYTSAPVEKLKIYASGITASLDYRHAAISWDLSVPVSHLYIDDISNKTEVTLLDAIIDYTGASWGIGALAGGTQKWNGSFGPMWFDTTYIDYSVTANRRFWRDSDGYPANLGNRGQTPTGSIPILYAPNGNPVENRGTGGNFVAYGSPTAVDGPFVSRISIYTGGTKGTDGQCPTPKKNASSSLQIGRESADTNMLDSFIQHIYITPQCFTDKQIARLP